MDHLIVGQGLAGSLLAWHLMQRGRRVLVVDRDEKVTSSKVAAGLLTPITGRQFSLPVDIAASLQAAKRTYWELEETSGTRLFRYTSTARLFRDGEERERWRRKIGRTEFRERADGFHSELEIDGKLFVADEGGVEILRGGWLDVPAFLEVIRQLLLERLSYAIGTVDSEDLEILPRGGVRWRNVEAANVVFCEGWKGNRNRFFSSIPMNNVRGDILGMACEEMAGESRIISRNGWLLPRGNGRFRAGATYDHDFVDESPTETGQARVIEKVRGMLRAEFEVLSHESAIRPVIRRSNVFMGRHPEVPDVLFFNGLGSKGVLNGPLRTEVLAEHLVAGKPIPRENDIREHFSFS